MANANTHFIPDALGRRAVFGPHPELAPFETSCPCCDGAGECRPGKKCRACKGTGKVTV
jgi:hypothetical protein